MTRVKLNIDIDIRGRRASTGARLISINIGRRGCSGGGSDAIGASFQYIKGLSFREIYHKRAEKSRKLAKIRDAAPIPVAREASYSLCYEGSGSVLFGVNQQ